MKRLLYLIALIPSLLFAQTERLVPVVDRFSDSTAAVIQTKLSSIPDVKKVSVSLEAPVDSTDYYGRAFIIIQTSKQPDKKMGKVLENMIKNLWKDDIILYLGIQTGIPGGPPCGPPPRKPC